MNIPPFTYALFGALALAFSSHTGASEVPIITVDATSGDPETNGMKETLRSYIESSPAIVDICIYEQEWIEPTPALPKGILRKRAVVTHSHHGSIPVGTKLVYDDYIEEPPRFLRAFKSSIPGELRTFLFDPADAKIDGDRCVLEGDGHFSFDRVSGDFRKLFDHEILTHPRLRPSSKPATGK